MIIRGVLALVLAWLTALSATSWSAQVGTPEEVCGKWLGGTTQEAEKWLACRRAYERGEIPGSRAADPAPLYCPIEVRDPYGGRYNPLPIFVQNRGNGMALGVQVVATFPVSGAGGGTAVMNRTVTFIDRLYPGAFLEIYVNNPVAGESYGATVSACVAR